MFKKTAIAALVLGFSGAASAAMYAPAPAPACAAGNVTVPCERSAWDLGVDALYMRSDDNLRAAGTMGANPFRAKFGWGFRLEGSYHFGTGNDATVNWSHYSKSTGTTLLGAAVDNFRSKFDVVNFEMGQAVDFGEMVDMRFQAGVQWLNVQDRTQLAGVSVEDDRYSGFGPRMGAMAKYDFGNGFGVYASGNTALLVGKFEEKVATAAGFGSVHGTALSTDMGLGVAYTHAMAQGDLTARLGWNVNQVHFTNSTAGQSWNGMNLGLKWVGNA